MWHLPTPGTEIASLCLLVTTRCNLSCSYCCLRRRPPREMDWPTLRRAIDWAVDSGSPNLEIAFSGGEPLLALPSIRRAVAYGMRRRGRRFPFRYALLTNGTLLREKTIAFLAAHRFDVQLSHDGVPAAQSLRGAGSFRVLDHLLDRLRADHPYFFRRHLSVALTVVPGTVPFLADSVAYLFRKRIAEISITPALSGLRRWPPDRLPELKAQFDRIRAACRAQFRRGGRIPVRNLRGGRPAARRPTRARPMCGVAGRLAPAIDVDGGVYGCAMLVRPSLSGLRPWLSGELRRLCLGTILDPDLADRSDEFREKVRCSRFISSRAGKYSTYGRCASCPAAEECLICPVSIGLQPGNEDPDRIADFNCAFSRVVWAARRRLHREIRREAISGAQ